MYSYSEFSEAYSLFTDLPHPRVRTSSGTFLARGRDKTIREIEKRISDFTFIPVGMFGFRNLVSPWICFRFLTGSLDAEHGEGLQVLHYEIGQKYEPHYDYFMDEYNTRNGGQRIATVLMYLYVTEKTHNMFMLRCPCSSNAS